MINFTHTCLLTKRVRELSDFYKKILGFAPEDDNDKYVEFHMDGAIVLAIYDIDDHNAMAMEAAVPKENKSVILEFRVDDAAEEYKRLSEMGVEIVKPLTTQAWGNTSFWFKDIEGNYLNFYSR